MSMNVRLIWVCDLSSYMARLCEPCNFSYRLCATSNTFSIAIWGILFLVDISRMLPLLVLVIRSFIFSKVTMMFSTFPLISFTPSNMPVTILAMTPAVSFMSSRDHSLLALEHTQLPFHLHQPQRYA